MGGDIWSGQGLVVHGPATLNDTTVRGSVFLKGARFDVSSTMPSTEPALSASRLRVGGDLNCRNGFVAHGLIDLRDSRFGGSALFEGAELTALHGQPALNGNGVETGGALHMCGGFTAHGRVSLINVMVRSRVCLDDAALDAPAGESALSFLGSTTATVALRLRKAPAGVIDLRHSEIGLLEDDPEAWPTGMVLDGAVYDSPHPALPARERLPRWGSEPCT
ncbi:hypothetical protein [Streptomyces sp. P17]|uniref:hypothetical protein n=1 Tax=Streptomyces sp. P17 TaxID=3074716 RepID=UPI0028F44796|nr:hypothetical protein [Streptomyces sp. P17]MDT9700945.1 hypothetical protein [Streptomyces sp. P17]